MKISKEVRIELTEHILPFWQGLKDENYGGYYGFVDYELKIDKMYRKGCILNSRILWFFSNACMALEDEGLKEYAEHAYRFLRDCCIDREYGGVFWSVTYDGVPDDTTKHTYNQAFAVYALSSYYKMSGDREALELAKALFELIEEKCTDEYGYLEAFTRDFRPETNEKLSENGVLAEKTMNTLLHVLEGFTEYYRVSRDERAASALRRMLDTFYDKVYNRTLGRQEVFFDRTWNTLIDLYSYGHDIETSWLIDETLDVLGDEAYREKLWPVTAQLAENIYERAYTEHSVVNESEEGTVDTTRVWWVQAESVVGFYNAYEKTEDEKYLHAAEDIWNYIKEAVIDRRKGSEWFWSVGADRRPDKRPIVEPWKCPYHNGRMCMELMRRSTKHDS